MIEDLQDEVIDIAYDYFERPGHSPDIVDVELVYQNTTEASMMRPLVLGYFIRTLPLRALGSYTSWDRILANKEIILDMMIEMVGSIRTDYARRLA